MSNQKYRKICYLQLAQNGYSDPKLIFERRKGSFYNSYWASGNRRMEVFYDRNADELLVYELKFIS